MVSKRKPLVVILGCTGTGKSDLGVAIAKNFNGEVISADSMQIYKGLDIATNKITPEEMKGVVHHMMSFVEPSTSTYNVHQFTKQVLLLLEKLWHAEKLPVVVGGTGYYIERILFKHNLIFTNTYGADSFILDDKYAFEDMSDDEVYELLKRIDLKSAMQVHKNNRFRVVRALQIYYATGRRKSEYLEEQNQKLKLGERLRFPNLLLCILDARPDLLENRLSERTARMIERGLRNEIEEFYEQYQHCLTKHGIAQSIAVKEFHEYLQLDPEKRHTELGDKLFTKGCEALKLHTLQYSRRQRRWIKHHFLLGNSAEEVKALVFLQVKHLCRNLCHLLKIFLNCNDLFMSSITVFQLPNIKLLDTSENFHECVVPETLREVGRFLHTVESSTGVAENQHGFGLDLNYRELANQIYHCESCGIDVHGTVNWQAHLKGKKHHKMLKKNESSELKN
ncbi:unnamed protein product [Thelazia callipaeda]|uniref:C2H2-type domain-containing protein n=1 Tax=Thelazia callipaeda TaxID=103827 RepID=A0A0N5CY78_THECL|nr:unnamed protein product [Thelazia callipaeda]